MTAITTLQRSSMVPVAAWWLFSAVLIGALIVTLGLRLPGFIHHDTSEVVMWGHSGWSAGFWKHPPFLPWVSRLWFSVLPISPWTLALLTAANMTLCAWAVWRIAHLASGGDDEAVGFLAVLLLAAVPFASGMAVKLNHNSALISLWALTTLTFLRALDQPTLGRGALFGLAAAAAMLTKYYSGLLLFACLVASVARVPRAMSFYRSPAPYVAVVVFALAVTPHALWLLDHRASTLGYAFASTTAAEALTRRGPAMALSFAVQTLAIMLPMAIAALLFRRAAGGRSSGAPHRFEREIIILAVVPYITTILLTAGLNMRGAIAWAMPLFVCLPAVAAARLGPSPWQPLRSAAWIAAVIVAMVSVGGQFAMRSALGRGADGISEPRREIAEDVTTWWRATTAKPLTLVAGDQRLASAAVIFSPDHPQAWPSLSRFMADWIDPAVAAASGYIALCRPQDSDCLSTVRRHGAGRELACPMRRRVTYLGSTGPWFEVTAFLVPPAAGSNAIKSACPPSGS